MPCTPSSTLTAPTGEWSEDTPARRGGDWTDPAFFGRHARRGEDRMWRILWGIIVPADKSRWLPTPAGYVIIVVGIGLLVAAYTTTSNILFIAVSLLASCGVLSVILCVLNMRRLRWRIDVPPRIRAGEKSPVALELANAKRWFPSYSIVFRVRASENNQQETLYLDKRLDPGHSHAMDWIFLPEARGQETLEVLSASTEFPFGFIRKTVNGRLRREILVWPRRIEYEFRSPSGQRSHLQGNTNLRTGGSSEIINIRRYQRGDPQRLVHWKASARQRQLMIRQMAEENRDGYLLRLETPAGVWENGPRFELLCSLAATLAEDLFREGRLQAVAINDQPVLPIKRLHDLHTFFDHLATLEPREHYHGSSHLQGLRVITFQPASPNHVNVCINGSVTGSA